MFRLILLGILFSVSCQAWATPFAGPGKAPDQTVWRLSYPLGNGCGHFLNRQLTEDSYLISCLVSGDLVRRDRPEAKISGLNAGWYSGWVTYLLSVVNGKPVIDYVKGFDYWSDKDVEMALKLLKTKYKTDPKKTLRLEQHQKNNWRKQCLQKLDNLVKTKLLGHTGSYLNETDRFESPMHGILTVYMSTTAYKLKSSGQRGQPYWPNVSYLCWQREKAGLVSEEKVVAVQPFGNGTVSWLQTSGAIFENGKFIGAWPQFRNIRIDVAWLFKGKKHYKLLFAPADWKSRKSRFQIAEFRPKGELHIKDAPKETEDGDIDIMRSLENAVIVGHLPSWPKGRKCKGRGMCQVDLTVFDGETLRPTAKIEYPFHFDYASSVLTMKNYLFYLSERAIYVTRFNNGLLSRK